MSVNLVIGISDAYGISEVEAAAMIERGSLFVAKLDAAFRLPPGSIYYHTWIDAHWAFFFDTIDARGVHTSFALCDSLEKQNLFYSTFAAFNN